MNRLVNPLEATTGNRVAFFSCCRVYRGHVQYPKS